MSLLEELVQNVVSERRAREALGLSERAQGFLTLAKTHVRVRESNRARTARIIVGPRRPLEVIVPAPMPDAAVGELLEEKRKWLESKVARTRAIAARQAQLGLEQVCVVWVEGRPVPVERDPRAQPVAKYREAVN